MSIREFAKKYRLRVKRDQDGTTIIPGRFGHLWEDGPRLAVTVFGPNATPRGWNNRRRACEAVGMDLTQDGDAEGTLEFDPGDPRQARVAIKAVGAYRRYRIPPEELATRSARMTELNARRAVTVGQG